MYRAFALLSALFLAGCATSSGLAVVEVPVVQPCPSAMYLPPSPTPNPELDTSSAGTVVKGYAVNREQWIGYAEQLEVRLRACQ